MLRETRPDPPHPLDNLPALSTNLNESTQERQIAFKGLFHMLGHQRKNVDFFPLLRHSTFTNRNYPANAAACNGDQLLDDCYVLHTRRVFGRKLSLVVVFPRCAMAAAASTDDTYGKARSTVIPSKTAIRKELKKLLDSPLFGQSERLARFLNFTVDHAVNESKDVLKEFLIGTEVYDRRPPYHPSRDSIVRTEARRLRSKLKEYYETEGKNDPVLIYYRPGSYVPVFRSNTCDDQKKALAIAHPSDRVITVAVLPFQDGSGPRSPQLSHSELRMRSSTR